jgi:tetratricopeptide (TPR) repeat protein
MTISARGRAPSLRGRIRYAILIALSCSLAIAGATGEVPPAKKTTAANLRELEAVEIGAVRASTAGLLLSGQAGGTVDGALIWSLTGSDEAGRVNVPFIIEVEGKTLLVEHDVRRAAVGIYAYVVDGEGRVVDHVAQGLILDHEEDRRSIRTSGLKFIGRFALRPADYTLRVMVQNEATGDYFMGWAVVSIPVDGDYSPHLLPILFPDPGIPWVVARQNGEDGTFLVGERSGFLPTARPTVFENRPTVVYIRGDGWQDGTTVRVSIANEIGRTVSEPLAQYSEPAPSMREFRQLTLAPIDLPPGQYRMTVTMAAENHGEVVRRAMNLTVVGVGETLGWSSDSDPAQGGGDWEASDRTKPARKLKKKELRAAYRRSLIALGNGDAVKARQRVAELERRIITDGSRQTMMALGEAELAEARSLAEFDPSCLMPLAMLHRDLYRGYTARREGFLANHARRTAMAYATLLGREVQGSGFSEGLMVNFASDVALAGASGLSRELLEFALRLNPNCLPALLSLGFSFERNADAAEAIAVYRRLVDAHPSLDEGRLRLAVNLIRTGRDEAGEELLQSLMTSQTKPWIQAVAAQELVRHKAIRRKDPAAAEREARAAVERLPDNQPLRILLAAILEKSGRHDEAIAVLNSLPRASRGVSPRARYAEWPVLDGVASQAFLNAKAAEAIPALKSALAARGEPM